MNLPFILFLRLHKSYFLYVILWVFCCLVAHLASGQVIDTTAVRREVDSLIQMSQKLTENKQFEAALEVVEAAEEGAVRGFGYKSVEYANCLYYHGRVYHKNAKHAQTETYYLRSDSIFTLIPNLYTPEYLTLLHHVISNYQALGKDSLAENAFQKGTIYASYDGLNNHINYAKVLINYSYFLQGKKRFSESIPWLLESKSIAEKNIGKESDIYLLILRNLWVGYGESKAMDKVEPLLIEYDTLCKKVFGVRHPNYNTGLYASTVYYYQTGQYAKSLPYYYKRLKNVEMDLGKESVSYTKILRDIGTIYNRLSMYEKSGEVFEEVLAIQGRILGTEHPEYAITLNKLQILYSHTGQYEQAESYQLRAIDIFNKNTDQYYVQYYLIGISDLAIFYGLIGQSSKSIELSKKALVGWEKFSGKETWEYSMVLSNLSAIYHELHDYTEAKELLLESKEICRKVRGIEHPDYANLVMNLGVIYDFQGKYEVADSLFDMAQKIYLNVLGTKHFSMAELMHNRANLYANTSRYKGADSLYTEAGKLWMELFGKACKNYLINLCLHAELYQKINRFEDADRLLLEATMIEQSNLISRSHHLSSRELYEYSKTSLKIKNTLASFSQGRNPMLQGKNPPILCFENALFHKGFLLQTAIKMKQKLSANADYTESVQLLASLERRLEQEYSKPIAERGAKTITELEVQSDSIQKVFTKLISGYGEAYRKVGWIQIRDHLQPHQAAIEFISYQYHSPDGVTDSIMYAALLVRPDDPAPIFIPLCEQKQLEAAIGAAPQTQRSEVMSYHYDQLYGILPHNPQLYHLIWKPLESHLKDSKIIFFSPDGLLHRLNIGAISDANGVLMCQRYQLTQMGSTRRLVQPTTYQASHNNIYLWGGIEYGLDTTKIAALMADSIPDWRLGTRGNLSIDSIIRKTPWRSLPNTYMELESIAKRSEKHGFSVTTYTSDMGTEEAFKQIGTRGNPSPRVLHLATHGFFFPDPSQSKQRDGSQPGEQIVRTQTDPMRRSGLVLAGANYAWAKGHSFRTDLEDGILTAAEVKAMNLSNTELVVLSACETGLGDQQGNEGVYGLQRAFKIAGAKYIIMSLWSVDDQKTQLLMDAFYANWFEQNMDIPTAFRAAQNAMRDKFKSPYYWAGFVLME